MNKERSFDVLIAGGGPAASTAAILLADVGIPTTIITGAPSLGPPLGQSLLPHHLPILDQLGIHDTIRQLPSTLEKQGVSFVTKDGG
jgi:2-polyprenyl-6-methoxyphenol hydroxylase-like FAD-dependent oxidoreductase